MFSNIMFFTVFVSDQDRALRFYEMLGFEKRADNPGPEGRFLLIGLKGSHSNVILWQGTGGKAAENTSVGAFFLQSEDLHKTFAELRARGVNLLEAQPEAYPYGLRATAVDPDGNHVSLRQVRPQPIS